MHLFTVRHLACNLTFSFASSRENFASLKNQITVSILLLVWIINFKIESLFSMIHIYKTISKLLFWEESIQYLYALVTSATTVFQLLG